MYGVLDQHWTVANVTQISFFADGNALDTRRAHRAPISALQVTPSASDSNSSSMTDAKDEDNALDAERQGCHTAFTPRSGANGASCISARYGLAFVPECLSDNQPGTHSVGRRQSKKRSLRNCVRGVGSVAAYQELPHGSQGTTDGAMIISSCSHTGNERMTENDAESTASTRNNSSWASRASAMPGGQPAITKDKGNADPATPVPSASAAFMHSSPISYHGVLGIPKDG